MDQLIIITGLMLSEVKFCASGCNCNKMDVVFKGPRIKCRCVKVKALFVVLAPDGKPKLVTGSVSSHNCCSCAESLLVCTAQQPGGVSWGVMLLPTSG